jgi:diguanylate cyclase (GGDEF)-like protein/PAS domain S-box-containing protein
MDCPEKHQAAIRYIRDKVNQLLTVLGTLPLRPEELDDDTLIELDPIGIVAESFDQVLEHLKDTNRRLDLARGEIRAILDNISAAVVVLDRDDRIDECNRRACEWFFADAPAGQIIGQPAEQACVCSRELAELRRSAEPGERQIELDGRQLQVVLSKILDEQGQLAKTVVLFIDITRLKAAEAGLRLYAQVFANLGEGILITDADNRIVEINQAFSRITGYSAAELCGRTPSVLRSGLHEPGYYEQMWHSIHERGYWRGEILDRAKDGRLLPMLQNISEVRDSEGRLTHYISVITDISSLKETQSRLDYLAHHDMLTNLPNRLLFKDRLCHAIERARRENYEAGLLFVDLDRFKHINDSLGHQVGDQLLIEAAQRLRTLVRRSDTVARLGGDEFVVLMEKIASPYDAAQLAAKIVEEFKQPFPIKGADLHLGCSVGVAVYPEDGADDVSLLRNADVAMYKAKEAGREAHVRYNSELSEASHRKLALDSALRAAIREQVFELHYQPIIDSRLRRVVAAEALLRWPRGPAGDRSPERFIPLAEETRLILPLGRWVLRQALGQFARWRDQGLTLDYLSVNLSAVQLAQSGFVDELTALLAEAGVAGHHLQLELTEHVLMADMALCSRVLASLRQQQVRVAIDDFGTGYSSLAYLKQLPIDNLKIDRSFVRDIPGDANDCAIAAAVIGLARTLGLDTIAEGIETAEQDAYLAGIDCTVVQGYYYSPALPADAFARYARDFR